MNNKIFGTDGIRSLSSDKIFSNHSLDHVIKVTNKYGVFYYTYGINFSEVLNWMESKN